MAPSSSSALMKPPGECPPFFNVTKNVVSYLPMTLSCVLLDRLDGKHVVFGSVVEGLDVIRKVEGYGSKSGKTSAKIVVADCGQL